MSAGFNHATLLGRLCAPPEELTTKGGKLFIKATIAVSVHRKNSDGLGEEHTSFVPATMFGKTAELFLKYVAKGDIVHLAGRLDSNEWKTEAGKKRLSLSFIAEQLTLLPNDRKHAPAARPAEKPNPTERQTLADLAERPTRQPNLNEYGEPDDVPF
jgi:single-strand DNA-binding protein